MIEKCLLDVVYHRIKLPLYQGILFPYEIEVPLGITYGYKDEMIRILDNSGHLERDPNFTKAWKLKRA